MFDFIAAAQSGDIDCIFANLFKTPERSETIQFSEPTYAGEVGVMVQDTDDGSFAADLKASFWKTFIREGRWRLFVSGIGTTLLITILSIICGTLLGFTLIFAASVFGINNDARLQIPLTPDIPEIQVSD